MIEIYMEVGPAYGRDYKNQKDVKADWAAGTDFQILDIAYGGRYISKPEADAAGFRVIVRYAAMRKVVAV